MAIKSLGIVAFLWCVAGGVAPSLTHGAAPAEVGHEFYKIDPGPYAPDVVVTVPIHDDVRGKEVNVRLTFPTGSGTFPVIIWSHQMGSCKDHYGLLMTHLASHGYVCIQPDHNDSINIPEPQRSGIEDFRQRPLDVSLIINSLGELASVVSGLSGKIDDKRIGVGGAYIGAGTSDYLSGAKTYADERFDDDRISAALLMCPQGIGQALDAASWEACRLPRMVLVGTRCPSARTGNPWMWRTDPIRYAPGEHRYLHVIVDGDSELGGVASGHVTDWNHVNQVKSQMTAFFDAFVSGNSSALQYLNSGFTVFPRIEQISAEPPYSTCFIGDWTGQAAGDVRFLWEFGDGTRAQEQHPCTTYLESGMVTAVFTVTDGIRSQTGFVPIAAVDKGQDIETFIEAAGANRRFLMHIPTSYDHRSPVPMVLMFHQGYTSAEEAAIVSGFSEISDREGFVVVYPHGERGYWNVDESNPAIPNALDDLGFIEALIAWLRVQLHIRDDMIYSAGICIGEAFSHKLAAERSDLIAAIGVVAGAMKPATYQEFAPEHPVSVIKFHGKSDYIVPWDGEADRILSSEDTVRTWAEFDGCPLTPVEEELPDVDLNDGCSAWRKTYGPGRCGTEAVLYGIEGGGHNWPGQRQDDNPYTTGKICRDVSASEEIWAFFDDHPKRHAQDMLFSEAQLEAAAAYSRDCGGSAVLVMTDGQVVFEEYQNGATADTAPHIASATKGFWASALAAALEDGLIDSVDERAAETITEWLDPNRHPGKSNITMTHLATLCSGLSQDVDQIQGLDAQAFDIYQYVVDQLRILRPPGEWFQYGPSHYYAFGVVLSRKLADHGMNPDPLSYLEDRILDRIGVAYDHWERDGAGNPHIPNGCYITPRSWIKYGQFLLQRGTWNGVSIVDETLMQAVFDLRGPNPGHAGFLWTNGQGGYGVAPGQTTPEGAAGGFLYHHGYTELLGALGAGKNRMYLLPRLNSVVLRQTTGDTANFVDHEFLARLLPQTVARDDDLATIAETPIFVDLRANDVDADRGPLTVTSITQPTNGQVSLHADCVSYVPAPGFTGVDLFAYTVADDDGHTDSGDVTVTVSAAENTGITHQPSDRWVTHVTSASGGFNTRVLMTNFGEESAQLTLQPCTLDGQTEHPIIVNIDSGRSLAIDAVALFAEMSVSHLSVVGPDHALVTTAYRAAQGAGASAHVTESTATATGFLIYPADQDLVFDGCALVNTGSGAAAIQLALQDADGGVIVTDVLHEGLPPHAKLLHTLDGYDLDGVVTAAITSDQPLSALFLRGTRPGVQPGYLFQVMPVILTP